MTPQEVEEIRKEVERLREDGLSYSGITKVVEEEYGVRISKATVIRWCKGESDPLRKVRRINLESPLLAYVVGVYFGDGSVSLDERYRYRIRLKVIDREFAEAFAKALEGIGLRPSIYWENDSSRVGRWVVEATSKELYMFLTGSREKLFEVARRWPVEFLRGFFDSEGSVSISKKNPQKASITADNYDKDVLEFCRELLEGMAIHSTVYLARKKGTKVVIRGQEYRYTSDLYRISIHRRRSVAMFAELVGFTIPRKQERLELFLQAYYSTSSENNYHRK
ncbi:Similar to intein-encoded homing endonucleases [Thermococcus chitonophagus]|uniref:Similar to intein-encoded homing endonucleases n=1 Tax=Thermococcus chitonophagus TaxID=54262 RepID=A0A160VQU0_9EURY|nr:Similar to intein-encoded homing endonucleases [Thermococcus chitonophagus]